jgi:uncharacterized membrane protein
MALFDKIRYTIALLDFEQWALLIVCILIFNLIIFAFLYISLKSAMVARARELEQERDEYKKYWERRDLAWKDREDELKRVLHIEKEREISQLKAEYDSYVGLLEQKLDRSKTREDTIS